MQKIILASGSARRRELLTQVGVAFDVHVTDADESFDKTTPPDEIVALISARKAEAAAGTIDYPCVIIAADTIVYLDGRVIGKPEDAADAMRILKLLRGRKHTVYTGVTLIDHKGTRETLGFVESADVYMRDASDDDLAAYVATGEPLDKAGAYGAQGRGALIVERIDGDFYTVIGLPIADVYYALREWGCV